MSFTYNTNIPAANNDPSADQPLMRQNTNSIDSLIAVDHVGFGNATGGKHNQVTIPAKNAQGAQTDPESVIYTESGVASTFAEAFYKNQGGTYPLSFIKCYGLIEVAKTGAPSVAFLGSQNYNLTNLALGAVTGSSLTFTVDVSSTANIIGNNAAFIYTLNNTSGGIISYISYTFVNPTLTVLISSTSSSYTRNFSLMVLQY